MSRGEYPRLVTWPQGFTQYFLDLQSGRRWTKFRADGWKYNPWDGFRVLEVADIPPPKRRFDMGVVFVKVSKDRLAFEERKPPWPLRDSTLTRRNPFRRRSRRP